VTTATFPGSPSSYPSKDETAEYLEAYAREFELPFLTGVKVDRLSKAGDRFEVSWAMPSTLSSTSFQRGPQEWGSRPERAEAMANGMKPAFKVELDVT